MRVMTSFAAAVTGSCTSSKRQLSPCLLGALWVVWACARRSFRRSFRVHARMQTRDGSKGGISGSCSAFQVTLDIPDPSVGAQCYVLTSLHPKTNLFQGGATLRTAVRTFWKHQASMIALRINNSSLFLSAALQKDRTSMKDCSAAKGAPFT